MSAGTKLMICAIALAVAACDAAHERPATTPMQPAGGAAHAQAFDGWLGRWIGPEGTYLDLQQTPDGYRIEIRSLDGSAVYDGRAVADGIAFERAGSLETIRATDGAATGMKWLLDKSRCLTVRVGEGFCRD